MPGADVSVVIPVYNEEGNVSPLYRRVREELERLSLEFEVLFVDDGSTDGTLKELKRIMRRDGRVRVIHFHRNFGKANALSAGFKNASGRTIFTMDGDLQDDPREFGRFLGKLDEGFDLVTGWKRRRLDPLGKRAPSKLFNLLIRRMTGVRVHDANCGFKAYRREVVERIDVYGEMHRYIPVLAHARGFRVGEIEVTHHKRASGKSKYGLERLFKGFMDLVAVWFVTRKGGSPMHLFGGGAVLSFMLGLAGTVYVIYDKVAGDGRLDRPLSVVAAIAFALCIFLSSMGFAMETILYNGGGRVSTDTHYELLEERGG